MIDVDNDAISKMLMTGDYKDKICNRKTCLIMIYMDWW